MKFQLPWGALTSFKMHMITMLTMQICPHLHGARRRVALVSLSERTNNTVNIEDGMKTTLSFPQMSRATFIH